MSQTQPFLSLSTLFATGRAPNHPIAFDAQGELHWQQFSAQVAALCQRLNREPAKKVALCCLDSYHFAVGFFALCYSQKALILPGNYQPSALAELSSEFDLLLCDHKIAQSTSLPHLLLESESMESASYVFKPLDVENLTLTLFTSGSSGVPKAIAKTIKQLDIEIEILQRLFDAQLTNCRIESTVSHQHIYGLLFRLLWPLCAGRAFARYNLEYPEQLIAHAGEKAALISSPALLKRLGQEHQTGAFAAIFSSGGPLSFQAAHDAQQLFTQWPIEVFGSTETGGIAYRQQVCEHQPWTLFPGVEVMLNEERCLRLRSPHIDPHHWYQTADECELLGERQFILKGRTDRVIKIEEKRVSLVEVEKRLEQLTWISESAVIPMQENDRLVLVAALVLNQTGKQQIEDIGKGKFWLQLRAELRQWLEPIAIPRRYRLVEHIPLNSQGKRLNNEIEMLFQSN